MRKLFFGLLSLIIFMCSCSFDGYMSSKNNCIILENKIVSAADEDCNVDNPCVFVSVKNDGVQTVDSLQIMFNVFENINGNLKFRKTYAVDCNAEIPSGEVREFICNIEQLKKYNNFENLVLCNSSIKKVMYHDGSMWILPFDFL